MDRNPSPPPPSCSQEDEEDLAGGDCIGSTVYSKHWLFGVLSGLIQIVTPESAKSGSDDDEQQMELTEETENEICRVWDMSMDEGTCIFFGIDDGTSRCRTKIYMRSVGERVAIGKDPSGPINFRLMLSISSATEEKVVPEHSSSPAYVKPASSAPEEKEFMPAIAPFAPK